MIVHIPLNDVATLTVSITDQMQQDLIRCRKAFEDTGNGPEFGCKNCSLVDINNFDIDLCGEQRIIDAVMAAGDNCRDCFGVANGDCDVCSRTLKENRNEKE